MFYYLTSNNATIPPISKIIPATTSHILVFFSFSVSSDQDFCFTVRLPTIKPIVKPTPIPVAKPAPQIVNSPPSNYPYSSS